MLSYSKAVLSVSLLSAIMLVAAVGSPALAQTDDPNTPTTLDSYVQYALAQNAGLKKSFAEYKAALAVIPQAKALEDPTFSYGYWLEQMETQEKQRFGLMQMFPWIGTIAARTDAASAAARAAGQRFESARLETVAQTKAAYYEFAYLGRANQIAQANLELLRHFEQVVQARYRTAAGTHPDIIRAQIELAMFEDEMVTLQQKKKPAAAMVNAVLNRKSGMDLPWPVQEAMPTTVVDEAQAIAVLEDNNPQLSAMSFEIAAARSRIELAKKRAMPNVTLGIEWMQMDKATMPDGHKRDAYLASVSINLPIWAGSNSARVQEARSMALSAIENKTQAESDLASKAAELMFGVEDSRRKVTLYQAVLIPKAKEMLEVSEQAYRTGAVDFMDLIDAERKLLDFELAYERALADHLVSIAQLEALLGGAVPTKPER